MKMLRTLLIGFAALLITGTAGAQINCPGTGNSLGQASTPITSLPYQVQQSDQCLLKVLKSATPGTVTIPPITPGSAFLVSFWNEGAGTVTLQPLANSQGVTPSINGQASITLVTGQGAELSLSPTGNWHANTPAPGCSSISNASCSIPVYPTGSPYALNQLVSGSDGNIYQSQTSSNVANPTSGTECGLAWKPYIVSFSIAVAVPAQCATIQSAVTFSLKSVAGMSKSATGTINVADGTQTPTGTINLDSPFGRQYNIIGDATTDASDIINFAGVQTTAAIVHGLFELTNGNGFGTINGFTYNGPSNSVCTPNCQTATSGYPGSIFVYALGSGASVIVGPNVVMNNGYAGIGSFSGAFIDADGTKCTGGADGCYWAYQASYSAQGASASNSASPTVFAGAGFLCDNFAYCNLTGAFSYSNNAGVALFNNSTIQAQSLTLGKDSGGTTHVNAEDTFFTDTSIYNQEHTSTNASGGTRHKFTNGWDGSSYDDVNGLVQNMVVSNQILTQSGVYNNGSMGFFGVNKTAQKAFGGSLGTGVNVLPMFGIGIGPTTSMPTCIGAANLLGFCVDVLQKIDIPGTTSGTVTLAAQAAAGTYEWDWPITAGTAGQVLTSQGGAGTAMTWTSVVAAGAIPTIASGFGSSPTAPTTSASAFQITVGSTPGNTGVLTLAAAPHGWVCSGTDVTTKSAAVSTTQQIGVGSVTSVTLGNFTDLSVAGPWVAADVLNISCLPY